MSGSASERVAVVTASARSLPALMYSIDEVSEQTYLHLSAEQIGQVTAAIGHVDHVDAGHHLEQLAGDMAARSRCRPTPC